MVICHVESPAALAISIGLVVVIGLVCWYADKFVAYRRKNKL